jgi:hypothetical protein
VTAYTCALVCTLFDPAIAPAVGLDDGSARAPVYLYGHEIAPPFVLTTERDTLFLNGVPVFPKLRSRQPAPATPTAEAIAHHALMKAAGAKQRELEATGASIDSITRAVVEFVRADTALVDSVFDVGESSFWLVWRSKSRAEEVVVRPTITAPSRGELLEQEHQRITAILNRGSAFIVTEAADRIIPSRHKSFLRVRGEIRRARAFDWSDTASKWASEVFSESQARLFHTPFPIPGLREAAAPRGCYSIPLAVWDLHAFELADRCYRFDVATQGKELSDPPGWIAVQQYYLTFPSGSPGEFTYADLESLETAGRIDVNTVVSVLFRLTLVECDSAGIAEALAAKALRWHNLPREHWSALDKLGCE